MASKRIGWVLALAAVSISLAACDKINELQGKEKVDLSKPYVLTYDVLQHKPELVEQVVEKLKARDEFKGREIRIVEKMNLADTGRGGVFLYADILMPELDKNGKEQVKRYVHESGDWQRPDPVVIVGEVKASEVAFPLSQVDFKLLPKMIGELDTFRKNVRPEDYHGVKSFQIGYNDLPEPELSWKPGLNGPGGGAIRFKLDGTPIRLD